MNLRYKYFLLFIFGLLLGSCKNDEPEPAQVPTNFNLTSLTIDGKSYSTRYAGVSVTPEIIITFKERINHESASTAIKLSSASEEVPLQFAFSNNDSTVTINPSGPLDYLKIYNLEVAPS